MPDIALWLSSEDSERYRLDRQPDLVFGPVAKSQGTLIEVDPQQCYQSILGFGSSLEEASVYHLARMSASTRMRVLSDLVDPDDGLGWNLFRICFGSSDFTGRPYYSYDDLPPGESDPELQHFGIQKDIDYSILDIIRQAREINPEVRIVASPWSPPGWCKTSGTMCGGSLRPEYTTVVARYYRMAVQAYQAAGIPIHAMTLQNEPLMQHPAYPTCKLDWRQERELLCQLRAEFDRHDIQTEIWIFDHNFRDAMRHPARILADPEAYAAADGVAFHSYEGTPDAMSRLHKAFPAKDIYFTERSTWGTRGVDEILRYLRNWAKSYNAWVTCLDERRQPNAGPHPCSPTFVTVQQNDPDNYRYIPEFWLLGQVTRFVRRGAVRIESDYGSPKTLTNAAFRNPDGSTVLVVVNQTQHQQPLTVRMAGWQSQSTVPARTVATYVW